MGRAGGTIGTMSEAPQWWYCLRHNRVESDPDCAHAERLGPYPSQTAAEAAIHQAGERSARWDTDPRWNDD